MGILSLPESRGQGAALRPSAPVAEAWSWDVCGVAPPTIKEWVQRLSVPA